MPVAFEAVKKPLLTGLIAIGQGCQSGTVQAHGAGFVDYVVMKYGNI